jgi:hypothetical protein
LDPQDTEEMINMSYMAEDVVRVARSYHGYLDGLVMHAASFPREEWMDKGRHSYLGSERYIALTSLYEGEVPTEIREQLKHDVQFLLRRILDPRSDGDIFLETKIRPIEEYDHDEGND